jgi:membrane-associated protease RseP (regulator of RpoE activity)
MDQLPHISQDDQPERTADQRSVDHQMALFTEVLPAKEWQAYLSPPPTSPMAAFDEPLSVRRKLLHLFLFSLTVITTTGVGVVWFFREGDSLPRMIGQGLIYSFSLVTILTAHEMGHYLACRWYGVVATPPYFIPVPLPPVGSFGAFIKIKSPIPNRRALFDIGIAGPLGGFVFILPAALIAHYFAVPAPPPESTEGMIYFQSPLLFKFFEWIFGLPEMVELNPVMWAAWVGCLMTALNLLPVGQLDGGHVTYAVLGARGNRLIARLAYAAVIGLAIVSIREGNWNWAVWVLILTFLLRVGHPPVLDPEEPLGRGRLVVAFIGLLVFILCFMPVPIRF